METESIGVGGVVGGALIGADNMHEPMILEHIYNALSNTQNSYYSIINIVTVIRYSPGLTVSIVLTAVL